MGNRPSTSNPSDLLDSVPLSMAYTTPPGRKWPMINQPISNPTNVDEQEHTINTGQYDVHGELFNPYYKTLPGMDSKDEMKPKAQIEPNTEFELEEQSKSNQPSTSNLTNVDEQGQLINTGQYNMQGDLVIKQYQRAPPADVNALECNELSEESRTIMNKAVKGHSHSQDLKITDQSIFSAYSMQTATKPTTESVVSTTTKPTTACSSKTIGPKGGRIEVGGCALIVPAGALDEDVKITLTASLDLDNQKKTILTPTLRCEPSSLEFKLPVTIFLQTHYILDEELLAECKIQTSEDGINWSILQTDLSYIGRTLAFTTNHFTWYEGLLNWIKGKIDILSNVYMKTEKELVWAIHYNLDLNTEQLSENYLTRHNHRFSATKDLTLTIEENKLEKTIKIEPSSTEIKHADLTTKLNQHKPFLIEELPNKDVLLKATLRNEDESREIHFILPKHQSTNQSTTSSNPSNNPGNIILQGIDANHSALFSKNVYIGYRNCGI